MSLNIPKSQGRILIFDLLRDCPTQMLIRFHFRLKFSFGDVFSDDNKRTL